MSTTARRPAERTNDRWTDYETPLVEEDGDIPFRYRVQSFTEPHAWHVVDLTWRDGRGHCSCKNFECVAQPNFRRLGFSIPYAKGRHGCTECKHIRAAFDYMHEHVTIPMLAKFRNGIPLNSNP